MSRKGVVSAKRRVSEGGMVVGETGESWTTVGSSSSAGATPIRTKRVQLAVVHMGYLWSMPFFVSMGIWRTNPNEQHV